MSDLVETRCKYCGSAEVVRNGKSRKGVQNWLCRKCGKGFVDNKGLPRMKSPIDDVASAVYLYYTGSSLNEIRRYIEQQQGRLPSDATIYNWVTMLTKVAKIEAEKYTPKVGDTWVADETVLDIAGKKMWLLDIIDQDTRFLLATRLSETRGRKDIALLLRKAYLKAGKIAPKRILTDGWKVYPDATDLVFGSKTKHIAGRPFVEIDSTNVIERFQGTLKDRTKVMRGFKKPDSARLILDGWLIYYNFFRPHESLNDVTPAEKANIKFPFKDWLDLTKSLLPVPLKAKSIVGFSQDTDTGIIKRRRVTRRKPKRRAILSTQIVSTRVRRQL
jgi:putative transposase